MLKVRLYRPFSVAALARRAAVSTVARIAVLDRTKEPGAVGDPLYLDVVTALAEAHADGTLPWRPSRASSPAATACRRRSSRRRWSRRSSTSLPRTGRSNHFTVGIVDDVTHTSLAWDPTFRTEADDVVRVAVLRPRRRRHGRREQELDQDHRRGNRPLRPGLLRLRLEEIGRDHDLAPARRPAADPLGVPGRPRQLRRLPSVRVRRQDRRARARRRRRGVSAECAVRAA